MNKKFHNQKHLSLSDRTYIEQELLQGSSFSAIGNVLSKDPSTISKEVKRNRLMISPDAVIRRCRDCMNFSKCTERHVCGKDKCNYACRYCYQCSPIYHCLLFRPWACNKPNKLPYICNACDRFRSCRLERYHYFASKAQAKYEKSLSSSRKGINLTSEELQELNDLISPLIMKGQPLSHIFAVHADAIPVCRRTLYNYLDQRIFQAKATDIRRWQTQIMRDSHEYKDTYLKSINNQLS